MYTPPLSEFFWAAEAPPPPPPPPPPGPTPGSAPWPLMLWFEATDTPPQVSADDTERADTPTPTTAQEQKANATQSTRRIPEQRSQEQEILRVISTLGHMPDALPKWAAGKPGVKAEVRVQLTFSTKVFDLAWERLRAEGAIQDAD